MKLQAQPRPTSSHNHIGRRLLNSFKQPMKPKFETALIPKTLPVKPLQVSSTRKWSDLLVWGLAITTMLLGLCIDLFIVRVRPCRSRSPRHPSYGSLIGCNIFWAKLVASSFWLDIMYGTPVMKMSSRGFGKGINRWIHNTSSTARSNSRNDPERFQSAYMEMRAGA